MSGEEAGDAAVVWAPPEQPARPSSAQVRAETPPPHCVCPRTPLPPLPSASEGHAHSSPAAPPFLLLSLSLRLLPASSLSPALPRTLLAFPSPARTPASFLEQRKRRLLLRSGSVTQQEQSFRRVMDEAGKKVQAGLPEWHLWESWRPQAPGSRRECAPGAVAALSSPGHRAGGGHASGRVDTGSSRLDAGRDLGRRRSDPGPPPGSQRPEQPPLGLGPLICTWATFFTEL